MMQGVVKWFDHGKGYGFITNNVKEGETAKDFFVYFKDINMQGYKDLAPGQQVEFDTKDTAKGTAAINVTRIGEIIPIKRNNNKRK